MERGQCLRVLAGALPAGIHLCSCLTRATSLPGHAACTVARSCPLLGMARLVCCWPAPVRLLCRRGLLALVSTPEASGAHQLPTPLTNPPTAGHTGAITALAMDPWARFVVTGSTDGTARVWDLSSARSIHTLKTGCRPEQGEQSVWHVRWVQACSFAVGLLYAAFRWQAAAGRTRFICPVLLWLLVFCSSTVPNTLLIYQTPSARHPQAACCASRCRPAPALPSWAAPTTPRACTTSSQVRFASLCVGWERRSSKSPFRF